MLKTCTYTCFTGILLYWSLLTSCKHTSQGDASTIGTKRDTFYHEPYRPQFHFSPPAQWMNDPNGMVFYEGEYHLFYQYYPDSTVWGPMHWGHAISKDLVYWEHLPIALYPDSLGYIFSGSAVIDWKNTSGFGQQGQPTMVALYTYHDPEGDKQGRKDYQSQGIAYSNDRGRTWHKYELNPVIKNPGHLRDFRDPKVFWHEPTSRWIMTLAVYDHIQIWSSPDLKHWGYESSWGHAFGEHDGVWECPDLFPLRVHGAEEIKWVLIQNMNPGAPLGGSGTQYFVGDFDGHTFRLDPVFEKEVKDGNAIWLDYGRDNYAGVTWSDVPGAEGQRIFMGWMGNWEYAQVVPTHPWRSAMTLPCSLILKKTQDGYRLFVNPVEDLKGLRTNEITIEASEVNGKLDLTEKTGFTPAQMEMDIIFSWDTTNAADFGIELSNAAGESYRVGYSTTTNTCYSDRTRAGKNDFSDTFANKVHEAIYLTEENKLLFRVFFDVASSEVFLDNGAFARTDIFFPTLPFDKISLYSMKGACKIVSGKAYALKRIWR